MALSAQSYKILNHVLATSATHTLKINVMDVHAWSATSHTRDELPVQVVMVKI
jgi:hypothetical protein